MSAPTARRCVKRSCRVEALDLLSGQVEFFENDACQFAYRESRFKLADRGRYLILSVTYRLLPGGAPTVRYVELNRDLAAEGITHPTLAMVRETVLDIRRKKSMLLDPHDPNARSAGSFFINPALLPAEFDRLQATCLSVTGERIPGFPSAEGHVKIPAAWLIERAGIERGYTHGHVGISTRHTLAVVNHGGASAHEVIALAREVRDRVYDRFGIALVPEPFFVGVVWE